MFVNQYYNIWFCITEIRQLIFRCNIWCNIQISINHWQRFRLCRVTQQFLNNYDGNPKKYIIIHIGKHQAHCFFTAVWRRNTSDQDAPNKHLPIHGVGSESLCIKIKIEIFLYRDRKVFYSSPVANCVFRHASGLYQVWYNISCVYEIVQRCQILSNVYEIVQRCQILSNMASWSVYWSTIQEG